MTEKSKRVNCTTIFYTFLVSCSFFYLSFIIDEFNSGRFLLKTQIIDVIFHLCSPPELHWFIDMILLINILGYNWGIVIPIRKIKEIITLDWFYFNMYADIGHTFLPVCIWQKRLSYNTTQWRRFIYKHLNMTLPDWVPFSWIHDPIFFVFPQLGRTTRYNACK